MWLTKIVSSLQEIASAEFQEKAWVKGEVHDYCTFVETICRLYDDACFSDFIGHYAEGLGFDNYQIDKFDKLRKALDNYVNKHSCYENPDTIVHDPEWHKIRQLSKSILDALNIRNYLDPSRSIPKNAMLGLIKNISSPEWQERVWITERRPDANPFREWVENLLYSSDYKTKEIIDHFEDYWLSEKQRDYLSKLYDMLKSYWDKHQNEEDLSKIISDSEWHKIQSFAQEVLKIFDWHPIDSDEYYASVIGWENF